MTVVTASDLGFLGERGRDARLTTKVYLRLVPGHLKEDYDRAMPE